MHAQTDRRAKIKACGGHWPYRTKQEASAAIGWHLRCWKCRLGGEMNVFLCTRSGKHWHIGHRLPKDEVAS